MKVYAAFHKDDAVVKKSSSGGMFIALSDVFLESGDAVAGAVYDYSTHTVKHIVCDNKESRDCCCGSKYVQSYIGKNVYVEVENILKEGRRVLYTGVPCQISAIKKYLEVKRIDTTNLFTCEILCHGAGSPGIWNRFINSLEKNKKVKISSINFKDKRKGWLNPICIASDGNKEFFLRGYTWMYFSDNILRPSCYSCRYSCETRFSDVTIGDFWKVKKKAPDMYNSKGTSFILSNTPKGDELISAISDSLKIKEVSFEDVKQNNLTRPTVKGKHRDRIMKDYASKKTGAFTAKWMTVLGVDKGLEKLKKKLSR
ncbi:MAG: Coenzyme F420 hydrogenase/dehydrogenase, beta subunit C-terminal domain [Lachnospiraceae bacterium]|nr:Coenzyme F420 hydrogenase/dehydrogenase, beta subunit C-terminal domain [Lachnospiraceae bacterium]